MSPYLTTLLGPITGLLLGVALLAVVALLGQGRPVGTAWARFGWFLVALLGVAVVVIAALRLVSVA